jgi:hypothetical protein
LILPFPLATLATEFWGHDDPTRRSDSGIAAGLASPSQLIVMLGNLCALPVDWAATGTMLQGVGAIVGSFAVIVAASMGRATYRDWRRQQIAQKHIEFGERAMTAGFTASNRLAMALDRLSLATVVNAENAQESEKRFMVGMADFAEEIVNDETLWNELRSCEALAFAYFGERAANQIGALLGSRDYVETLAQDASEALVKNLSSLIRVSSR